MKAAIENRTPPPLQWDLISYDWNEAAGVGNFLNLGPVLENARSIGKQLAPQLAASSYTRIHLVAHSAGSHLINAMLAEIPRNHPFVQITFLDAYEPKGGANSNLGDRARFAEQYVDSREILWSSTDETLQFACNHDVTALDPRPVVWFDFPPSHAWPRIFYDATAVELKNGPAGGPATPLTNNAAGWGFNQSMALDPLVLPPSHATECKRGARWRYVAGQAPQAMAAAERRMHFEDPVRLANVVVSPTGAVQVLNDGNGQPTIASLSTGAPADPVWFTADVRNKQVANLLTFDWSFSSQASGGQGWLAVYLDLNRDGILDERDLIFQKDELYADPGTQRDEVIPLTEDQSYLLRHLAPGAAVLAFRIDPMTVDRSELLVNNIRFSLLITGDQIPTLSSGGMVILTILLLATGACYLGRRAGRA
jgi:hypothetical protein